jgi:hypothetical protein
MASAIVQSMRTLKFPLRLIRYPTFRGAESVTRAQLVAACDEHECKDSSALKNAAYHTLVQFRIKLRARSNSRSTVSRSRSSAT